MEEEEALISELKRQLEDEDLNPEQKLHLLNNGLDSETTVKIPPCLPVCIRVEDMIYLISPVRGAELGGCADEQQRIDSGQVSVVSQRRPESLRPGVLAASQQAAGQLGRCSHTRLPHQVRSKELNLIYEILFNSLFIF